MSRTELQSLGEFALIKRLSQGAVLRQPGTHKGIGDDAAVLSAPAQEQWLVSTDMLLEGVHFDLSYVPLKHLGYKAVVVNLSDIAAMNGIPRQIMLSLAASNRFSVESLEELYRGVYLACENYEVDLVGGDTTTSKSGLILSLSAIGTALTSHIAYRHGAKPKDILCVTGDLGAAYLGLQVLEREKQVFLANPAMQPDLEAYEYLVQRQLKPEARTDIIHEFREMGLVPSSMIDISDGLASEILHLCEQSKLGAFVFEDKLPIDKSTYETAIELSLDPSTCALNGGEDYELLFTISQKDYEKIKLHPQISTIGYMVAPEEGVWLKTRGGQEVPIQAQGWKHF
ncbi:MAG: thiamine-phosphate kinase [Microscillaceae bacterium]|nr:thiamine-phosphate kinase [Microscillaceae bacterium]